MSASRGSVGLRKRLPALLAVLLAVSSLVGLAVAALRQGGGARGAAVSEAAAGGTPRASDDGGGQMPVPQAPREVRISVAVSGDLLPHLPIVQRARALAGGDGYDFRPMLRPLRPLLRSADLALCHLEAPLQSGTPSGYPRFRAPPDLADAIKATGWDACSTASNHTLDLGEPGVRSTLPSLGHGIPTSARSRAMAPGTSVVCVEIHHDSRRPARARGAADPKGAWALGRLRCRKPALQPDRRVLHAGDSRRHGGCAAPAHTGRSGRRHPHRVHANLGPPPDYSVLAVGDALPRAGEHQSALWASWQRTVEVVGRSARVRPVPRRLP